ncbi:hypothetical protein FGO68_gene6669 [Halteria grandinella]|uniref:Uncharacterized protein n=1 Tax=Halteria grandinella TaxID=5974 RepID=A0A8J8NEP3_HALGN|nr:hypothetical protein FGO68_gene6669 [Halteria grandinella]
MSKLDFLAKKYQGVNKLTDDSKKRLTKLYQKEKQTIIDDDDKILTLGIHKKQQPSFVPTQIRQQPQRKFVQESDHSEEEEGDDIQPVIVGEDYGFMSKAALERQEILKRDGVSSSSDSDSDDSQNSHKQKRRRRHDSSDSGGDEQITHKRVDSDGDVSVKSQREVVSIVEKSGLQSASELKEFNKKASELQNKHLMEQIKKNGNTQNPTVYRNAQGFKVDINQMSEKDRLKAANEAQLKQWVQGSKQTADKMQLMNQLEEAKETPFARYELDKEAEDELKMKDRFGDPLKLIKSKTLQVAIDIYCPSASSPGPLIGWGLNLGTGGTASIEGMGMRGGGLIRRTR